MPRVRVSVPAACLGLGPGLDVIGLAIGLHNTVELATQSESAFRLEVRGEGNYPASSQHPAMRAADYLFKKAGSAPAGLALSIHATIPPEAGLGDIPALLIGGLVAANNLINTPFKREQLAEMAVELCGELAVPAGAALTSLFGGLVVTSTGQTLVQRRIDVPAQKLVLVLPEIAGYQDKVRGLQLRHDTSFHVSQSALLIEGFRKNDTKLIEQIMRDAMDDPRVPLIPGYAAAVEAGRKAGAVAIALAGTGPVLVALTQSNQKGIEAEMQKAFTEAGVKVRCWQLNMDTQGVALSVSD